MLQCSGGGDSWADLAASAGTEEDTLSEADAPALAWESEDADMVGGISVEGGRESGSSSRSSSSSGGSTGSRASALLPQWERYGAEGTPQGGLVRSDDGGVRGRRARRGGRISRGR